MNYIFVHPLDNKVF